MAAYFGVAGIHHDAVECDALFCKRKCELEMLWIGCMIEVHRDRDGGLMGTAV